jgi:dTDP-glucose 4,6-dehydratase
LAFSLYFTAFVLGKNIGGKAMNVLVTGGLGFIGSNFIKHIFDKYDYNIFNIDKLTYAGDRNNISEEIQNSERYQWHNYDLHDTSFIRRLVQSNNINYIVHFAAESHVDNSIKNADPFISTNINGTYSLLTLLHDCPSIKRYLQVSTDEVYGSLSETDEPFTEHSQLQPNSPYSASKASADLLCRSFHETFDYPILITRCSNNYGPNQHSEKLIPLMIKNAKFDMKLPVYGDGKNIRDWIHVSDHCSAIDAVLHKGKIGEVYNIGGNNEMRNIDIVKTILKLLEKSEDQIEYVEDRLGHDWRYAIDNSKIQNELNWSPTINFEEGLKELI